MALGCQGLARSTSQAFTAWALALCVFVACRPSPGPTAVALPLAPEEPACAGDESRLNLDATRSLWLRALAARERGNEAEAERLFECARAALEHLTGSPAELESFQSPEPIAWREGI